MDRSVINKITIMALNIYSKDNCPLLSIEFKYFKHDLKSIELKDLKPNELKDLKPNELKDLKSIELKDLKPNELKDLKSIDLLNINYT